MIAPLRQRKSRWSRRAWHSTSISLGFCLRSFYRNRSSRICPTNPSILLFSAGGDQMKAVLVAAVVAATLAVVCAAPEPTDERYWAQWRGPLATGVSPTANPPLEWSETKNIRWKVEIPGRGSASPIVWGDRIFLLTAVPVHSTGDDAHARKGGVQPRDMHRFLVLAIDRATGKTVWERVAKEEQPHEASHQDNGTWASSSAVTDGERVYAWFESRGMFVYDMDGKLIW